MLLPVCRKLDKEITSYVISRQEENGMHKNGKTETERRTKRAITGFRTNSECTDTIHEELYLRNLIFAGVIKAGT